MSIDESEPWTKRMKEFFERRGRDDWVQAAKEMFSDGHGEAAESFGKGEPFAKVDSRLTESVDKAIEVLLERGHDRSSARQLAEYLNRGTVERSHEGKATKAAAEPNSDETEADSDELIAAFDPFAERESNTLELEF